MDDERHLKETSGSRKSSVKQKFTQSFQRIFPRRSHLAPQEVLPQPQSSGGETPQIRSRSRHFNCRKFLCARIPMCLDDDTDEYSLIDDKEEHMKVEEETSGTRGRALVQHYADNYLPATSPPVPKAALPQLPSGSSEIMKIRVGARFFPQIELQCDSRHSYGGVVQYSLGKGKYMNMRKCEGPKSTLQYPMSLPYPPPQRPPLDPPPQRPPLDLSTSVESSLQSQDASNLVLDDDLWILTSPVASYQGSLTPCISSCSLEWNSTLRPVSLFGTCPLRSDPAIRDFAATTKEPTAINKSQRQLRESLQLRTQAWDPQNFDHHLYPTELWKCSEYKFNEFWGPGGNVDVELIDERLNKYKVHFPTAGWFLWPFTGLGFGVREAVTVKIALESWDQNLNLALQQDDHWMVAGPLFDITGEPEGAIVKIHLPHFVSLQEGEVDNSWFRIAHFKNEGMILEQPTRVEPFHAVLENPSFSLIGILLYIATGTRLSIPITSTTLLYYHYHPEDIRFHMYLIPSDIMLRKAIDEEEAIFNGVRLQTSPPVESLNFGSYYTVSGSAHLEIMPTELKLSYRSPGKIQPFSKIYAGKMNEPIHLNIVDKRHETLVWETLVKPVDLQRGAASALPALSGAVFIRTYYRQLQARMGELGGVLDDLQDKKVFSEDERELVEQAQTLRKKNRTLLDLLRKKGDQALELLYKSLSERDPYLMSYLRQSAVSP